MAWVGVGALGRDILLQPLRQPCEGRDQAELAVSQATLSVIGHCKGAPSAL